MTKWTEIWIVVIFLWVVWYLLWVKTWCVLLIFVLWKYANKADIYKNINWKSSLNPLSKLNQTFQGWSLFVLCQNCVRQLCPQSMMAAVTRNRSLYYIICKLNFIKKHVQIYHLTKLKQTWQGWYLVDPLSKLCLITLPTDQHGHNYCR